MWWAVLEVLQVLWAVAFDVTVNKSTKAPKHPPKAGGLFFGVLPTERRVVGVCWEKLKPTGPHGLGSETRSESKNGVSAVTSTERPVVGMCC